MKLPGLTIVPTKSLVKQLTRIADALEVIVEQQYGYRMTPTPAPSRDESDVAYSDDLTTWKQEASDIGQFKDPLRPVDVEEFEK